MKPNKYKAKALDRNMWFTGYYFEMPYTTYCTESSIDNPTKHYLIYSVMTDWGLPNEMHYVEIDINTLEEITDDVDFINTDGLKPCPFCGGEGCLSYSRFNDFYDIVVTIVCENCGAETEGFEYQEFDEKGWEEAKIKARQAWNRRM